MTTPTIRAALDTFQQAANRGTAVYLSPGLVQELRDALKAEPEGPANPSGYAYRYHGYSGGTYIKFNGGGEVNGSRPIDAVPYWFAPPSVPTAPPTPETPAQALAARPLLERVAAMGDCIGANTVGQITAISNRAAAWLRENPPGRPVAIEPRGCPTPGACSCVEPIPPATEPGEMPSDELMGQWRNAAFAEYRSGGEPTWRTSALLAIAWARQQQATELASLRGEPVAVSERMPGEEDLHPEGKWCWGWKYGRYWAMMQVDCFGGEPDPDKGTHWLPHTAIPLPAPQAGEGEA